MELRKYIGRDIEAINHWSNLRKLSPLKEEILPEYGLIVEGVAAGWMYRTDGKMCYLENFIANPEVPAIDRQEALSMILAGFEKIAAREGYLAIVGYSNIQSLVSLLEGRTWKNIDMNYNLLIKTFTEDN